jgi:hypothetical protein
VHPELFASQKGIVSGDINNKDKEQVTKDGGGKDDDGGDDGGDDDDDDSEKLDTSSE